MAENYSAKGFQLKLLDDALNKALKKNEDQTQKWTQYKKGHEKVSEALTIFPNEIHTNCMVPIGKRALMKGKLIHTNEILACIGDGYFAKYSAKGAIDLCQRRIKSADEMLENLRKERDLYEMKQIVPFESEAFADEQTKDITEFWEQEEVNDWKKKHREREKEYHIKLAEMRKKEAKKIETEEDLFDRLDELELEEELADELNRLDKGDNGISAIHGSEEEYLDSSDETDEEDVREILQEELRKLEEIRSRRSTIVEQSVERNSIQEAESSNENKSELKLESQQPPEKCKGNTHVKSSICFKNAIETEENKRTLSEQKPKKNEENARIKKSVSFGEIQEKILEYKNEIKSSKFEETVDESEIIKIEFTHSKNEAEIEVRSDTEIRSPRDIYDVFSKPKSILKRREGDLVQGERVQITLNEEDEDEEEEDKVDGGKESIYVSVVKDIIERKPTVGAAKPILAQNRPVSKFKRDRTSR